MQRLQTGRKCANTRFPEAVSCCPLSKSNRPSAMRRHPQRVWPPRELSSLTQDAAGSVCFLPSKILVTSLQLVSFQVLIRGSKTSSLFPLALCARMFRSAHRNSSTCPVLRILQTTECASWLVFRKRPVVSQQSRNGIWQNKSHLLVSSSWRHCLQLPGHLKYR